MEIDKVYLDSASLQEWFKPDMDMSGDFIQWSSLLQ